MLVRVTGISVWLARGLAYFSKTGNIETDPPGAKNHRRRHGLNR